jgi:hypothetical protein
MKYDKYKIIFKYFDLSNADINNMQKYLSRSAYINDTNSRNTARNSNINHFYSKREISVLIVTLNIIYKMQIRERINYINEYSEKTFAS